MSNLKLRITVLIRLVLSGLLGDWAGSNTPWQHLAQHTRSENINISLSCNINRAQAEVCPEVRNSEGVEDLKQQSKRLKKTSFHLNSFKTATSSVSKQLSPNC